MSFMHLARSFEIEADTVRKFSLESDADSQMGTFSGLASTFGNIDRHSDIIEAGAFTGLDTKSVRMLWAHRDQEIIGKWVELRQDERGLHVKGELNLDVQRGREAYSLLKQGAVNQLSVGMRIARGEIAYEEQSDGSYIRRIKKAELFEISIVAVPANPKAKISTVKSESGISVIEKRELEHALVEMGLSPRQAKKLLSGGYAALSRTDPERDAGSGEPSAASVRDAEEKRAKAAEMRKQLRGLGDDIFAILSEIAPHG